METASLKCRGISIHLSFLPGDSGHLAEIPRRERRKDIKRSLEKFKKVAFRRCEGLVPDETLAPALVVAPKEHQEWFLEDTW